MTCLKHRRVRDCPEHELETVYNQGKCARLFSGSCPRNLQIKQHLVSPCRNGPVQ